MKQPTRNRVPVTTYTLDSPFPKAQWPLITPEDQSIILDLLCNLLEPIGQHRRQHITPSKGKRAQKRKAQDSNPSSPAIESESITVERPEISRYITVGFNSTTRLLESTKQAPLVAVFIERTATPGILNAHFPLLCARNSQSQPASIRLVTLPAGAEQRLAQALGIHRAGPIGLLDGAPGSSSLVEFVRQHVEPIDLPWLDHGARGDYLKTSIKTVRTSAPTVSKKKKIAK